MIMIRIVALVVIAIAHLKVTYSCTSLVLMEEGGEYFSLHKSPSQHHDTTGIIPVHLINDHLNIMIPVHLSSCHHHDTKSPAVSCESGYWNFKKWKWTKFSFTFCSRSEKWNENLIHSFREWKVKYKCLEIEIESEKWNENASRSRSEISREFSRNLRTHFNIHSEISKHSRNEWIRFSFHFSLLEQKVKENFFHFHFSNFQYPLSQDTANI